MAHERGSGGGERAGRSYNAGVMFELSVQTVFSAAHALMIAGQREPIHGHDWHVTATVAGAELDSDGLLVDFHAVEGMLADITGPFRNTNLNTTAPFETVNPSAENVARHIAVELGARLKKVAGGGARVESVRVTEAHGCAVTYRARLNDVGSRADVQA